MAIITTRVKPKAPQLARYAKARKTLEGSHEAEWLAETFRLNRKALAGFSKQDLGIEPGILYEIDYEVMCYDDGKTARFSGLGSVRKITDNQIHFHTYASVHTGGDEFDYDIGSVPVNFAGAQNVWRETRIVRAAPATTDRIPVYLTMNESEATVSKPTLDALADMLRTGKAVI